MLAEIVSVGMTSRDSFRGNDSVLEKIIVK